MRPNPPPLRRCEQGRGLPKDYSLSQGGRPVTRIFELDDRVGMIQNRIYDPSIPAGPMPATFCRSRRPERVRPPRRHSRPARARSGVPPRRRHVGPGGRRWLLERRRLGPVIRALRQVTDPLFRHAGLPLD